MHNHFEMVSTNTKTYCLGMQVRPSRRKIGHDDVSEIDIQAANTVRFDMSNRTDKSITLRV